MNSPFIPHQDGRRLIRVEALWEHDSTTGIGGPLDHHDVPHNEVWHVTGVTFICGAAGVLNQLLVLPPWSHPVVVGRSYYEDYTNRWGTLNGIDLWCPSGSKLRSWSTNGQTIAIEHHGVKYIFEDAV